MWEIIKSIAEWMRIHQGERQSSPTASCVGVGEALLSFYHFYPFVIALHKLWWVRREQWGVGEHTAKTNKDPLNEITSSPSFSGLMDFKASAIHRMCPGFYAKMLDWQCRNARFYSSSVFEAFWGKLFHTFTSRIKAKPVAKLNVGRF